MPYFCTSCYRSFTTLKGLKSHCSAKRHYPPECRQCNRQFVNDHALQQHRQDSPNHRHVRRNTYYKPYHCTECNRSFADPSALDNHTRASHYYDYFESQSNRVSFLQNAPCPFCPSYFKSPSAVAQHIESGCHGITRHQVTHAVKNLDIIPSICVTHRIEGARPTPPPPTSVRYYVASPSAFNGRAYACFLCQRMFRSLSSLSDHLNSAAHDANEFKCPKCKKRFKLVSALTQHIESAVCGLAQFHQIQNYFEGLTGRFCHLISM